MIINITVIFPLTIIVAPKFHIVTSLVISPRIHESIAEYSLFAPDLTSLVRCTRGLVSACVSSLTLFIYSVYICETIKDTNQRT